MSINFSIFNEEFLIYKNNREYKMEEKIQQFYNNNIAMSTEDINKLCCNTMKQSKSTEWHTSRRL